MAGLDRPDVLIVSLGSTVGLRAADEGLADSLRRAGASVAIAQAAPSREVRTLMLTDLQWARAARAATRQPLGGPPASRPRAVIYSTTTAALLWRVPGAIRFDAPARANRQGRHGLWQRPLERRRLERARLLLPLSEGGLAEAELSGAARERALVLPLPVAASGPPAVRDIAAITYAANPHKKGLDRVLAAWREARRASAAAIEGSGPADGRGAGAGAGTHGHGAELVVAGAEEEQLRAAGFDLTQEPGVRSVGRLPAEEYRGLLRRSRLFICAPRREDYGAAQLEALADGCVLVTTPAPGPYAALPIARVLDRRLVDDDLGRALAVALREPLARDYRARAAEALRPYAPEAIDLRVAEELLPRLLG